MICLYVTEQDGDHVLSKDKRTETRKSESQFRNSGSFVMFIVLFSLDFKTRQCNFSRRTVLGEPR